MSRQQWVIAAIAIVIGAIVSVAAPGIYGVLIAIVIGLALGWAGSRFGFVKGDEEDET